MSTEEQQRYAARIAKIDARNKVAQQNYKKTIEDFKDKKTDQEVFEECPSG
jgi:hypothetical protein